MELSKREQLIVIAAVAVISLLVLDRYILTPFLDSWELVRTEKQRLVQELDAASSLFDRRRRLQKRWTEMRDSRLQTNPAVAESQVLRALYDWSQQNGLRLSSLTPEHGKEETELRQIQFQLSGNGPMRSVAGFLWDVETSSVPLKVTELQLSSAREGADRVTVQLRVSTLYVAGPKGSKKAEPPRQFTGMAKGGA